MTAPTGSRVVAGALAAANWAPLLEEARRLATAKKEEGEASAQRWREPAVARAAAAAAGQPGQTSKKRAKECAIMAHDEYEKAECEGADSKVDEGVLVALFKFVLGKHGISIQRFWNGALVGPDCRRLLKNHAAILEDVRKGIVAAGFGEAEARDFVDTHTAVLKELVVVSRLTRRVDGAGANRCLIGGGADGAQKGVRGVRGGMAGNLLRQVGPAAQADN